MSIVSKRFEGKYQKKLLKKMKAVAFISRQGKKESEVDAELFSRISFTEQIDSLNKDMYNFDNTL